MRQGGESLSRGVRPLRKAKDMTNNRFSVETAPVDLNSTDHVGYIIRDSFTGYPVRDGKGGMILVYGDRVAEVHTICAEMNDRTSGIEFLDSAVHVLTDDELKAAA